MGHSIPVERDLTQEPSYKRLPGCLQAMASNDRFLGRVMYQGHLTRLILGFHGQNFHVLRIMWWAGSLSDQLGSAVATDETKTIRDGKTFEVPFDLTDLEAELCLLEEMKTIKKPLSRFEDASRLQALPAIVQNGNDPLEHLDHVEIPESSPKRSYWSADKVFWRKWKSDELESRKSELERAKAKLEESRRELAAAAAARIEKERQESEEADRKKVAEEEIEAQKKASQEAKNSVVKSSDTQATASQQPTSSIVNQFNILLEEGKQYRTEFIAIWREISLSVSSTAANSRSIQQNATKLISALTRASAQAGPMRPHIMKWLCAFCGSKIASQATSGNKSLVWTFAYLGKLIGERFPDVVRIGIIGELARSGSSGICGTPDITGLAPDRSIHPKGFEIHARFWVAFLIVLNDEISIWGWVSSIVSSLAARKQFLVSNEAMWNMMKLYVFIDCGLHDFKRIFGKQANTVVTTLESSVFPALDAELQSSGASTNVSVQFRFYLDACFNNLQSRNYQQPPEGQILTATAESELNPEL